MKKIFFFVIAAMMSLAMFSQGSGTAYVTLKYCKPDVHKTVKTICNYTLPYDWHYGDQQAQYTADDVVNGKITDYKTIAQTDGCDTDYYLDLTIDNCLPEGAINGLFSVSATQKVYISKGNLRYSLYADDGTTPVYHDSYDPQSNVVVPSRPGRWRFAENQWDLAPYICNDASQYNKYYEMGSIWLDLLPFGMTGCFSSANYDEKEREMNPELIDRSTSGSLYATWYDSGRMDFGQFNPIENGGNQPGLWRMFTQPEWQYLIKERTNHEALRSRGTVNNIKGLILLPDDWDWSKITKTTSSSWKNTENYWSSTVYSGDVWIELEANGAVFFPNAGRISNNIKDYDEGQSIDILTYMTCTPSSGTNFDAAPAIKGTTYEDSPNTADMKAYYPVRLIQDFVGDK